MIQTVPHATWVNMPKEVCVYTLCHVGRNRNALKAAVLGFTEAVSGLERTCGGSNRSCEQLQNLDFSFSGC